jgi:hypothetical protein
MKGEIFNFILFSDVGTGTSVANKCYFVDWNRLPDSRYKLTFAFTSSTVTLSTTFEAMLYISELGCVNNTIVFDPSGIKAYNQGYIGILRDSTNAAYIQANTIDNPPSFLRSRPTANQINIRIHQNLSTTGTDYTPLPTRYTLILSFEQLDEDEGNKC